MLNQLFVTHVKHFNLKIRFDDMDNIIYESVCEGLTLRHTEHPGQKLYISVRNNKSVTLQTEKKKKETFSKLSTAYKNSVLQLPKVPINTSYKLLQATESHS